MVSHFWVRNEGDVFERKHVQCMKGRLPNYSKCYRPINKGPYAENEEL